MIKEFIVLSFVLVLGFVSWGIYEWSKWPIDYSQFQPELLTLGPLDTTYESRIVPKFFEHAQVITNEEFLRFPEDIAVSNDGTIYTGLQNGTVAIITAAGDSSIFYNFNNIGGIYGIIITSDDKTLYFVSEFGGLIKLDIATKTPTFLLKSIDGKDFAALNNLCIDEENQIIYMTDATTISMRFANKEVMLKHKKGRIISFNLTSNEAAVVLADLTFPNGIVYEKSTKSIIFSEFNLHRISRYYVGGCACKLGKLEIVTDNLFGYGDNLKLNEKGELLVAIPATRDHFIDLLNDRPALRKLMMYLPEKLLFMFAQKRAGGVRIDTKTGEITEYLFGAPSKTYLVTTVLEKNNKIYFSSLKKPTILVLDRSPKAESSPTAEAGEL